ncbi:hypothetical protein LUZ60_010235 [Juncus effusus]|nr:hypothetical protein LUZ60_010235 [Juncus effusus]
MTMEPLKKSKKKLKRKSKKSTKRSIPLEPIENRALETEWWYSFLQKSSDSGVVIPSEEDEAFRFFFRVSKRTFEYICSLVREDLISRPPSGLINIEGRLLSVEKQVAIAMRRLASGDSQVSVGAAFGVGQSTVSQVTWRFIESMEDRSKHHLKWPDPSELEQIKSQFESKFGIPNCCGAIDTTHIIMTLPAVESSEDWFDTERNYSMFLQGIVDYNMRFLDIVTGYPGSMTFAQLLKLSGFYNLCETRERLNGSVKISKESEEIREFIVGDLGFPILPWLMTPYEVKTKTLESSKLGFNERIDKVGCVATKALARLKGTWRILHKVMWRPDKHKLPSIVLVCCLLHNIIIDKGDELRDDVALPDCHDVGYKEPSCEEVDLEGKEMRERLKRHLCC